MIRSLILSSMSSNGVYSQLQKLEQFDIYQNAIFGNAIAISDDGNTCAISAPGKFLYGFQSAGTVYIFVKNLGAWESQSRIELTSGWEQFQQFGNSVSLSSDGNTLAVGCYYDTTAAGQYAGSVFIYTRTGSTWSQQTQLDAEATASANDFFGHSVSISNDGNTLAVGASSDDPSGITDAGAVYIFTRSGVSWSQQTRLVMTDRLAYDYVGDSVSLSSDGNTLAVGVRTDDNSGGVDAGSVYIFTRSGISWSQQTRLQAADASASDWFGSSVSLSSDGNIVAIGASYEDNIGGTNAGSVYVFTRSGSTWTQQQKLTTISPSDATKHFGRHVSISSSGDVIAIGQNAGGSVYPGNVYIYTRIIGGAWVETTNFTTIEPQLDTNFGVPLCISSDGLTCLIGSPLIDDQRLGTNSGACYVFDNTSGATWTQKQKLVPFDGAINNYFGQVTAISSDGLTCAIGTRRSANSNADSTGRVFIFTRSGYTWTRQFAIEAADPEVNSFFGFNISLSSDGNTIAISASAEDNAGGTNAGSVYVFTRSGSTWTQQQKLTAGDPSASDAFGSSVSLSSDGNTLAVGAYLEDNAGGTNAGSVYIFTRSDSTWTPQQKLTSATIVDAVFGSSVSLSSDGNTLAVGSPGDAADPAVALEVGSVYIWTRSGSIWTQQQKLIGPSPISGSNFGDGVFLSGDGNVCFISWTLKSASLSSVVIYEKSFGTWGYQQEILNSGMSFAYDTCSSYDGSILCVGASTDNGGFIQSGSVRIYKRSGNWKQIQKITPSDPEQNADFGSDVSCSSDGRNLIIGSSWDDSSDGIDAGSAYYFLW